MTSRPVFLLLLALLMGTACSKKTVVQAPPVSVAQEQAAAKTQPPGADPAQSPPKRIILFVGDGMGVAALTAAAYVKGHKTPLEMMQMPQVTVMRTHEHEFVTTDSAASATAFATGHKTHFEGVSVRPGTLKEQEMDASYHLETLVTAAKRAGLRTGLVATSRIVHATPAAFAAHRINRNSYEEIAQDVSQAGVDVLLGAGSQYFNQRADGQDLLGAMQNQGYAVALDVPSLHQAVEGGAKKLVGLVYKKDMPPLLKEPRSISLAALTDMAIQTLDRENPNGFFLMVEGSQIDWEEHAMNAQGAILETLDFDQAVGAARRYAQGRDDTLVVTTADHETGGLSVLDDEAAKAHVAQFSTQEEMDRRTQADASTGVTYPPSMQAHALGTAFGTQKMITTFGYLSMASRALWKDRKESFIATHTATMVPLMAQGKWAERVVQVQDNADLGRLLRAMILHGEAGLEPEARAMLGLGSKEDEGGGAAKERDPVDRRWDGGLDRDRRVLRSWGTEHALDAPFSPCHHPWHLAADQRLCGHGHGPCHGVSHRVRRAGHEARGGGAVGLDAHGARGGRAARAWHGAFDHDHRDPCHPWGVRLAPARAPGRGGRGRAAGEPG